MLTPKIIYIETTNQCNAKCVMCPHSKMKRPKGFMSDDVFKKTIQSLKNIDLSEVTLFLHKEGEPLLDPKIIERIQYVKQNSKNLKELGINTNAMLLTEKISKGLLKSGLDTIYFSVDGASARTYNQIRIGLEYSVVEKNIEKFFELRGVYNSSIRVVLQMLICPENNHEVESFKAKWQNKSCEFYIKQMHCYLDGGSSSFSLEKSGEQLKICEDPFNIMIIYIDGNAGVCCWDYDNSYKVGNIKENTLVELFNNEKFSFLREKQLKKDCSTVIPCNRCMKIFGNDVITAY